MFRRCMCVCVCCVCVRTRMHACAHMVHAHTHVRSVHMEVRIQPQMSPGCSPPWLCCLSIVTGLELSNGASLTDQQTSGIYLPLPTMPFPSPRTGTTRICQHSMFFTWALGMECQVFMLLHVLPSEPSPQPHFESSCTLMVL